MFKNNLLDLQSVIGRIQDNVVSFGPLAKNNEWHIVLKSEEAKNKLLSAGQLLIKGVVFGAVDQFRVRCCGHRPTCLKAHLH